MAINGGTVWEMRIGSVDRRFHIGRNVDLLAKLPLEIEPLADTQVYEESEYSRSLKSAFAANDREVEIRDCHPDVLKVLRPFAAQDPL